MTAHFEHATNAAEQAEADQRQLIEANIHEFAARGVREFSEQSDREATAEVADHLATELGIRPEFYEHPSRALLFLAAANTYRNADEAGRETVMQATRALARGFADKVEFPDEADKLSSREEMAIAEKYVDPLLTEQLKQYIAQTGMLAEVQQAMGGEQPYELKVLNIANSSTDGDIGVDAPKDESPEATDAWLSALEKSRKELKQLEASESKLARELKQPGEPLPMAWALHADGLPTIYLHKTTPYKLLSTEGKVRASFDADERKREEALLLHEYTHTQNFTCPNTKGLVGITLEERRAELFSGDRHGYQDVKGFFDDINTAVGANIEELLRQHSAERDATSIYLALADKLDLTTMLEIALVKPGTYSEQVSANGSAESAALQQALGGYAGVVNRIVERFGDAERISSYVDRSVAKLHEYEIGPEFWASYMSGGNEPSVIKQRVIKRYHEIYPES